MSTGTQLVCPHIKSLGLVLKQILVGTFLWRAGRTYKKMYFKKWKNTPTSKINLPVQSQFGFKHDKIGLSTLLHLAKGDNGSINKNVITSILHHNDLG